MAVYSDNLLDERTGRPIEGADLWVYTSTGSEATLTDALDQPLTQPLTTDADGAFEYKAADGVYRHDFWKNSVLIYRDNQVIVGTPATVTASLGSFGVTLIGNATAADARADLELSGPTGASNIGKTGGGTAQDVFDQFEASAGLTTVSVDGNIIARFNSVGQTTGGSASTAAKMTIYTQTTEVKNAIEVFHYADQTFAANQTLPFVIHNYTDAVSATIDTVGTNVSLRLKQARNAAARPDKPSTFIGTGRFIEFLRARVSGSGNTGDGVDILASFDNQGLLRFYGSNGADWDGTDTTAPVQFGSYTGFFTKSGYMGWDYANSQFIIGSIESGVAFQPIQLACSLIKVLGDGTVNLASSTNRLGTVHTVNVKTSPVAVSALPAAGTIGSGARAFVNDSNVAASGNFGAVVAGGGANNVPVYSDGSNWRIG